MLLLALMVPWTAKAQTIETIGNGTYNAAYIFPGRAKYSYSACLYKPDVAAFLNYDFILSSIAYDFTRNDLPIDELTIWVKDVSEADYSLSNYMYPFHTFSFYIDGATQV